MVFFAKLLKALHSDAGPWSLAFGIALGMIVGLTPLIKLHNVILLFFVLFFRVNLSTFLLSWGLFSIFAYVLDPLMNLVGETLLTNQSLLGMWTAFYSTSIGRLSQFYHTLTLGSLVISLLSFPLVLFASKYLVIKYRQHFLLWIEKWRVVQVVKGSRVYQIYQGLGG